MSNVVAKEQLNYFIFLCYLPSPGTVVNSDHVFSRNMIFLCLNFVNKLLKLLHIWRNSTTIYCLIPISNNSRSTM